MEAGAAAGSVPAMRILVVGAGGVGVAAAAIARHRPFFERLVLADVDPGRAQRAAARLGDDRIGAAQVDAGDEAALVALIRAERADVVLNACDPRFNPPIFAAAGAAGVTYLDMAMTLSEPHPERPHEEPGVKLGDRQFAEHGAWEAAGRLALVGIGVEPGLSDVFARHAADALFSRSTRSACATARTSWSRATPSPRRSPSGPRSRSA
jgi:saccharopine dehydrogenase-like NADP-dependent oxidoreductase